MTFRYPSTANTLERRAYKDTVTRAAHRAGIDEYTGAMFLCHWLEAVADQLCKGRYVNVLGFGLFTVSRRNLNGKRCKGNAVTPRFIPHQGFRNQVRASAFEFPETNARTQQYTQINSRDDAGRAHLRTFDEQEKIRQSIARQLRRD